MVVDDNTSLILLGEIPRGSFVKLRMVSAVEPSARGVKS